MKTYAIYDAEKRLIAFEIGNLGIGRRAVCRIIDMIPGVALTRKLKLLSWFREQVFCEFLIDGAKYVAEEPWGDNSTLLDRTETSEMVSTNRESACCICSQDRPSAPGQTATRSSRLTSRTLASKVRFFAAT